MSRKRIIAVAGSGHDNPELNALAERTGVLIAESGAILVNGGLGGVMRSSARGCRSAGGTTVGLLPGLDPDEANEFIDVPVATGLGEMRNFLIVRAAGAVIALGTGYGTLSEVAIAIKTRTPVIGLNTWDISKKVISSADPEEAVSKAVEAIRSAIAP